jgi:Activator of Hsp90 ATPase homolog 1-like protein
VFLEASLLDGDGAVVATARATEWPGGSHVESLLEISLQWLDGRTLLTLTQRGVPAGDVEGGFSEGWNEFLDGLVARIQTRPAS